MNCFSSLIPLTNVHRAGTRQPEHLAGCHRPGEVFARCVRICWPENGVAIERGTRVKSPIGSAITHIAWPNRPSLLYAEDEADEGIVHKIWPPRCRPISIGVADLWSNLLLKSKCRVKFNYGYLWTQSVCMFGTLKMKWFRMKTCLIFGCNFTEHIAKLYITVVYTAFAVTRMQHGCLRDLYSHGFAHDTMPKQHRKVWNRFRGFLQRGSERWMDTPHSKQSDAFPTQAQARNLIYG